MKKRGLLMVSAILSASMICSNGVQLQAGNALKTIYVTNNEKKTPPARTHELDDTEIPIEVQLYAEEYGAKKNICPELIEAIIEHESQFELEVVAITDLEHSVGPAQINLKCSDHYDRMEKLGLKVKDLNTYKGAIEFMADYLSDLFENYEDPAEVLMRYNGDKTGLKKYWKTGEISDYAKEILERSEELERRHGK